MAKTSKRTNLLIILVPIIILLVGSSYFAFIELQKYMNSVISSERFNKIEQLKTAEQSIVDEIVCIAQASGVEGDIKELCKEERSKTDALLSQLKRQVVKDSILHKSIHLFNLDKNKKMNYGAISSELSALDDTVKNIRYDIDTSRTITIDMLINGDYYQKVIDPIEDFVKNSIKEIKNDSDISSRRESLDSFQAISDTLYHTDLERILVTYYISSKDSISSAILRQWDSYISASLLPEIEGSDSFQKTFKTERYGNATDAIEEMRIDIITNYITGEYGLNVKEWIEPMNIKVNALSKALNIIINNLSIRVNQEMENQKRTLLLGLLLMLLSIIFAIYLVRYFFRVREEDVVLEKVVTGIEKLSLQDGTQAEGTPIMPQNLGNKKEVYTYLESILQLLHKKEVEADEANQAKSQFLANMSHEIRTPLNGIVGFIELLRGTSLDEDQKEFISIIQTSSNNLLNIINDVLDLSKINAEQMDLESISFDLFEQVESTVETFSIKAEQKDITLGIYIEPTLTKKWIGDPTKISQILTNLIGNALKFTPTRGMINVRIKKAPSEDEQTRLTFTVEDSGIGIDEEALAHIFEAFTQEDSSVSRKFGGTGLGLTISRKMAELMGGELQVESQKGKGTTFFFTIALDKDENAEIEKAIDLKSLKVGLALPSTSFERDIDSFLESYILSLNAKFKIYYYKELFDESNTAILPNIMIFDHHFAESDEALEKIQSLDCDTVLITTGDLKGHINPNIHHFSNTVYAPMTLGKCIKILKKTNTQEKGSSIQTIESRNTSYAKYKHVLVAEDNTINQKLIKVTLEQLGLFVTIASNGKEAFYMRRENDYDIIFMDIQMPIMNGEEATEAILDYEQDKNLKHIPIVALTANALSGDREKYIKAGMDDYLSKPIQLDKLEKLLAKYFPSDDPELREDVNPDLQEEIPTKKEMSIPKHAEPASNEPIKGDLSVAEAKKAKIDILLYVSQPLLAKVYRSILSELKYSVDTIDDQNEFLDKLEENQYLYVLYEGDPFGSQKDLIRDIIQDVNAKSLMLIPEQAPEEDRHNETLEYGADIEEVKNKLNMPIA